MPARHVLRLAGARPAVASAAICLLVRSAVVLDAWATNPLARSQQLDGGLYLDWARDIAAGDLLGRAGTIGGEPFLFNPLYAYVLAPLAAAGAGGVLPALCLNAVLAAATAGFAAGAARRFAGVGAAWFAGLLVAFSAALAHLDAHVAVSELAALLVAGACFSCAPAQPGDRPWAHGPVASALWLGFGALARPVVPLAVPFAAWLHARRAAPGRAARAAAAVCIVFAATAVPTLLRNWLVADEPALWTAAGGINLHLGNNPQARVFRSMVSPLFPFHPVLMHEHGRTHVRRLTGVQPTRGEVGAWFRDATLREIRNHTGESLAHYANKARWYLSAVEVPSSASYNSDRRFQRLLPLAFVPTWAIAALGVAGAWVARRDRALLLGPGAIVAAHVVVLTAVFPLSHYRSPSIPALAVLAGAGFATLAAAVARRDARPLAGGTLAIGAALAAGNIPPGPDEMRARDEAILAIHYASPEGGRDFARAELHGKAAIDVYRAEWPGATEPGHYWTYLATFQIDQGPHRAADALACLDRAVAIDPDDPRAWIYRSGVRGVRGDLRGAEADALEACRRFPDDANAFLRLGEAILRFPGREGEAALALRRALELEPSIPIHPDILRAAGVVR